jgi:hypothetical protein
VAVIEGESMSGDWAEELGDNWVTVSPGIYVHVADLQVEPAPKLRVAESAPAQPKQQHKLQ